MALKIGLIGHSGKMGKILQELIAQDPDFFFSGGINRTANTTQENDFLNLAEKAEVLIDFSQPSMLAPLLAAVTKENKALVIGTTGFSKEEKTEIQKAAQHIPILYSPNFSLGIALLRQMACLMAEKIGAFSKIKIKETHHTHKKDKPSGTALFILEELQTILNLKDQEKKIPIEALRIEDAVGKHEIFCALQDEKITLTHEALNRKAFARGALLAAKFLYQKPAALYKIDALFTEEQTHAKS